MFVTPPAPPPIKSSLSVDMLREGHSLLALVTVPSPVDISGANVLS